MTQRDPVLYQAWEAHEAIGAALLVGLPLGALLLLLVGGAGGAAVAAVQAGGPAPLPELAIVLLLLLYNDDLDEQIGDLGVLLSEMDPTSAYEVAWNVAHVPGGLDARVPIVGT